MDWLILDGKAGGGNSGDTGDFMLDGTSGDGRNRKLSSSKSSNTNTEASCCSPSAMKVWAGIHSIPSNSTSCPTLMHGVVWSDSQCGLGSRAVVCSVLLTILGIAAGVHSVQCVGGGWLGSGVGLVTASSAGQMVTRTSPAPNPRTPRKFPKADVQLSAAPDSVDHKILFDCAQYYAVRAGTVPNWLRIYLMN
ncbi:hypothetical protein DPX16_5749 [Anabarilius grahami]|uniref:Uncharacterized protein n=1 Tax=Anabarilius grahami TaxID=495550 RepID=A0A3N0Z9X7_ANAGA|nr:hypothetical protein DPX16_5749 [Anabarilius grahami]